MLLFNEDTTIDLFCFDVWDRHGDSVKGDELKLVLFDTGDGDWVFVRNDTVGFFNGGVCFKRLAAMLLFGIGFTLIELTVLLDLVRLSRNVEGGREKSVFSKLSESVFDPVDNELVLW